MPHPHDLMEITQPQAESLMRESGMAIIPTGSLEQHGAHLPLGTDYYAALVFARAVAERIGGVVVPCSPIAVTPLHMSFVGTVTIENETFIRLLEDICASLVRHGIRRIVFMNWHEFNQPALGVAAINVQHKHNVQVVVVQAHFVTKEMFGDECGGLTHGGELEVLPVLYYDEGLADLSKVSGSSSKPGGARVDAIRRNPNIQPILSDVRQLAPTGWYGEPQHATVEKAKRVVNAVADRIAEDLTAVFDAIPPVPSPRITR